MLNLYSAYMSSMTIFTSMNGARRTPRSRKLLIIVALITAAGLISALARDNFQAYFADGIAIQAPFMDLIHAQRGLSISSVARM